MRSRLTWHRGLDGWVSDDGAWRVRGPLMGQSVYWLYRIGRGRVTPTGRYQDAVRFTTALAAQRYAERLVEASVPR